MMNTFKIVPALHDEDIKAISVLAEEIWNQHFTPLLGDAQVNYMVEKFQSYPALKRQIADGYEYFQIHADGEMAGYTGVHQEEAALFLSKLYLKKSCRGKGLSTRAFHFLIDLCKERALSRIWLTCNKYNEHTLDIYKYLGFEITSEQVADIGNGYVMDDYILNYIIQ